MKKNYKILIRILPFLFIGFIWLPMLNGVLHIIPEIKNTENRKLAEKPIFNISLLDPFPKDYTNYFEDNISFRAYYITLNSLYNYFFLKKSVVEKKVVIGNQGWLYRNNNALPVKAKKDTFDLKQISNFKKEIKSRTNYYKKLGIKYYLFIVPNKATIYPEFVAKRFQNKDGLESYNRVEHLMSELEKDSIVNAYYLKDLLFEKKQTHQVFYKKDHHWNAYGALFGAGYILEKIKSDFSDIKNYSFIENYNDSLVQKKYGNLSHTIGLQEILNEDFYILTPKKEFKLPLYVKGKKRKYKAPDGFAYPWEYKKATEIEGSKAPKILVIRDSFTNAMIPFLSNSFSDALYIWDAWDYQWNKTIVKEEKPDIVVNIIIEQNINKLVLKSDIKY